VAYCHYLQMGRPSVDKNYTNWADFIRKNPQKVK
jgi:crossover junction endodeoxyribonuclease RuvC